MSLILDALKRARQLGQGKPPSTEAQNLMRSFGTGQRARRRRTRKIVLYAIPILLLAGGMAFAGNYWLKKKAEGSMSVARDVPPVSPEPTPPAADPPATEQQQAPPSAEPVKQAAAATPKPPATTTEPPRATPPPRTTTVPRSTPPAAAANPPVETVSTPPVTEREEPARAAAPPTPPPVAPAAPAPPLTVVRNTPAGSAYDRMRNHYELGEYPEALALCPSAKQEAPKDSAVFLLCGATNYGLRKYAEAEIEFSRAVTLSPNNDRAFVSLAAVYIAQQDYRGAFEAAEKAIRINPANAGAYYNRGLAAAGLKQSYGAKNDLMMAVQKDPGYIAAHLELAKVYDRENEIGLAIEHYERFHELAIGLPPYRTESARAHERIEALKKRIPAR